MVEAAAQQRINSGKESAAGQVVSNEDKKKFRDNQAEFLKLSQTKKNEVVMKFKRSNDAVLTVFTPSSYNGYGHFSCSADHNVRIIKAMGNNKKAINIEIVKPTEDDLYSF